MAGEGFKSTVWCGHRGKGMKKILIALMMGIMWLPLTAKAQQWVEPHTRSDGTMVEGHWVTPQDRWKSQFSTPGSIDPFTGHFNRYGRKDFKTSNEPRTPAYHSPMIMPGSSSPNPYAIPGSSTPNQFAIPGSSPKPDEKKAPVKASLSTKSQAVDPQVRQGTSKDNKKPKRVQP
jgi:hypothetical protein